jgi:hypothetical protein
MLPILFFMEDRPWKKTRPVNLRDIPYSLMLLDEFIYQYQELKKGERY